MSEATESGRKVRESSRLRAADVMTSPAITVRVDTPVKDVAATMLAHHISGLPVVSPDGDLVGIVTEGDLLFKELERGRRESALEGWVAALFGGEVARKTEALTARELMTAPVVTVDEETALHEIAALMVRRKINRVPVLRQGRLVGIVSRADVLKAFARSDREIEQVVRGALLGELWIDVDHLQIDVRDGIVYLAGEVETESEKRLAERWVLAIDGVVAVESTLRARFDERTMRGRPVPY